MPVRAVRIVVPQAQPFCLTRRQHPDVEGSRVAFEHHAVVQSAAGAPLVVVHEQFLTTLFA
jgi:hypothetical protein